MKMLKGLIKKRRFNFEAYFYEEIKILIDLINTFTKTVDYNDLKNSLDDVVRFESNFENYHRSLIEQFKDRSYLPFYWQDLYSVSLCLKRIMTFLNLYYNKCIIFRNDFSFSVLFDTEIKMLNNTRSFFEEYLDNRKYVHELLKNNYQEIKNFSHLYLSIVNNKVINQININNFCEISGVFEKINNENENLNNSLNKILIGTNI